MKFLFLFTFIDALKVWKGVRYAEPVQRWQAPEPYQAGFEDAVENRQESYSDCPQGNADQTEDCLRLGQGVFV